MKNGRKNINPIWILIAILLLVIGMPVGAVIYFYVSLNSSMIAETLYDFRYVYIVAIAFPLFIVVFVFILLPVLRFIFKRIACYFSLWFSCKMNKFKFKITRFPFVSFFGVKTKEDLCVTRGDEKYFIHFIDIIGRAKVFTLIDGRTYNVSKTAADNASITPLFDMRFNSAKRLILDGNKNIIPGFDKNDGEHIIMLDPPTMEVRYIENNVPKPLFSGYSVGNITYYEAKDFIKLLKRV